MAQHEAARNDSETSIQGEYAWDKNSGVIPCAPRRKFASSSKSSSLRMMCDDRLELATAMMPLFRLSEGESSENAPFIIKSRLSATYWRVAAGRTDANAAHQQAVCNT